LRQIKSVRAGKPVLTITADELTVAAEELFDPEKNNREQRRRKRETRKEEDG